MTYSHFFQLDAFFPPIIRLFFCPLREKFYNPPNPGLNHPCTRTACSATKRLPWGFLGSMCFWAFLLSLTHQNASFSLLKADDWPQVGQAGARMGGSLSRLWNRGSAVLGFQRMPAAYFAFLSRSSVDDCPLFSSIGAAAAAATAPSSPPPRGGGWRGHRDDASTGCGESGSALCAAPRWRPRGRHRVSSLESGAAFTPLSPGASKADSGYPGCSTAEPFQPRLKGSRTRITWYSVWLWTALRVP